MPSPATPHRSSNHRGGSTKQTPTKQKPLDIGQPLGAYDTNSVRSKVRKWQQQGGGVVTANDCVYYEEEDENSTTESKPKDKGDTPKTSTKTRDRSHSTPRKRLVSDEHWKLNRSSAQTPPPKAAPPKRFSNYTTNDSIGSPRAGREEFTREETSKPSPSSRSRSRARTTADLTARERRKSRPRRDVDSIIGSTIEEEEGRRGGKARSMADKSQGDESEKGTRKPHLHDDDTEASSEAELSKRRPRSEPKDPKERKEFKPPHDPLKIPKNGIFGHMFGESKKIFARPDAPKPGPPRGSKIEAWLSETHDPFVDDAESDVEIPAPLNTKGRAKRPHKREDSHDRATESEPTPDGNSRRRSSHIRRSKRREDLSTPERPKSAEDTTIPKEKERKTSSSSNGRKTSEHRHSKSLPSVKERDAPKKARETKHHASDVDTAPAPSEGSEVSGNNAPIPLGRKRPFPTTGAHQLSTIASEISELTTSTDEDVQPQKVSRPAEADKEDSNADQEVPDSEERDQFDPNSLPMITSQLRRRLTTHDDLISVLSTPNRSRSLRSARSIRSNKSRATTATVADLLKELSADEAKYMRELKTLVGGVIPVLLTCVLSRSDSAIAAGLFRPSMDPKDELNFTKPIVDMGVAIERLKTLHKRIPQDNAESLVTWASGAQKVYRDYLRAWRLGFRDVIVNLAPLEEGEEGKDSDTRSLDEGMARDENGDVVDNDGEKVDVAYLLKRPLVRLKYLAKTFKGVNLLQPSPKAEEIASAYQALVTEARRRAREERARLEDESAAAIDATRARDPGTLGVLPNVVVDRTRRVRARDFFNLSLYHSSGQVIDCRAEFLLRDNASQSGPGGDLLICEIDHSDRWLLFPPVDLTCVSARNGDSKGELVVMIRNGPGQLKAWQELLFLRIDEEDIAFEWVQLLGLNPVPPNISRSQSFIDRAKQRQRLEQTASNEPAPSPKLAPNPSDVDVPIGEKATSETVLNSTPKEPLIGPSTVGSSTVTDLSRPDSQSSFTRESAYASAESETPAKPSTPSQAAILHARDPRARATPDDNASGLKRSKAKRISRYGELSSPSSSPEKPATPAPAAAAAPGKDQHKAAANPRYYDDIKNTSQTPARENKPKQHSTPKTPTNQTEKESPRVSSVPSMDLPLIPKLRSGSSQTRISQSLRSNSDDEFDYLESRDIPESPTRGKGHSRSNSDSSGPDDDAPPPPPPHRTPSSSTGPSLSNTPILSPSGGMPRRRGSSPLKHEYEPSTASDEYSDSDTSTVRHYEMYSESDYSASDTSDDDSESELESSLPPVDPRDIVKPSADSATSSLSPSNSASQSGYRSVPPQPSKSSKTVASVFGWSDKGSWETLYPDECSIVVSPGLIEAYKSAGSTSPGRDERRSSRGQPVVALELTPLVPIRRGTAIDISIRSPPTERSRITWSNNIMFRSRNPDECEVLYGLINNARINNPTYIALQNARGPYAEQPAIMEPSSKSGGSFGWPLRRKSYRASSSPRSLADNSESSVGTMSSAFSALKRFGAGSKMFSIARSTVTSRKDGSLRSQSTAAGSSNSGIGRIAAAIKGMDGIGLSNAKIRLYFRESQTKWRDMGAARLTIMPASSDSHSRPGTAVSHRSDTSNPHDSRSGSPPASGPSSPRRGTEPEKRILIRGKTRGEILLDVCLGESSFERVARTGIALSMREDERGASKSGGVTNAASKIYMIQMKSEAEAAYTFGLVGKLKY